MLRKSFYVSAVILALISTLPVYSSEWVAESDKDGIKVYTRAVEGSNVREFKGETIVNYNYKKINEILNDIPNLENWMADAGTNCLLDTLNVQSDGSKEIYMFSITTTPFGVAYRCGLFYSKITVTENQITRTVELANDSQLKGEAKSRLSSFLSTLPIKKNGTTLEKSNPSQMVYFSEMKGLWTFDKLSETQTKITWTVKTNPGGSIPITLANSTTKSNPYKTLMGLKTQIK